MAKKATLTNVEDVKVGDMISQRNVLRDTVEFFKITYIRHNGDIFVLNYGTLEGQEVDYMRLRTDDQIYIITEE